MGSRALVHRLATEMGLETTVPYRVWFEGQQVMLKLIVLHALEVVHIHYGRFE